MKWFCKHDWDWIVKNREIDVYDDLFPSHNPIYRKIVNVWICKKCGKSKKETVKI